MQLLTDWDGFLAELQDRWPRGTRVYLAREGKSTVLTVRDEESKAIYCCRHNAPIGEVAAALQALGHTCHNGAWSTASENRPPDEIFVSAVAYFSDGKQPGLWVDVGTHYPTPSSVIAKLLAEFHADGTLSDTDHDTFHKVARPNVVILTPDHIQNFLAANANIDAPGNPDDGRKV